MQHFGNVGHNSACFCWGHEGDKPYWAVRCQSRLIFCESYYLFGLQHDLRISTFRPPWLSLIVEVLATRAKFLEPSNNWTVIDWAFSFLTTNVFDSFHGVMTYFQFVKRKLPNETLCGFQIVYGMKQYTTWQRTNYRDTTNHNRYVPQVETVRSCNMRAKNHHVPKYCETFDSHK